jgi:hypothetical protein
MEIINVLGDDALASSLNGSIVFKAIFEIEDGFII